MSQVDRSRFGGLTSHQGVKPCDGEANGKAKTSKIAGAWVRLRSGVGIGLGGIVVVLAVSFLTGTNPLTLLNLLNGVQDVTPSSEPDQPGPMGAPTDSLGKFASVVLADTEETWQRLLPTMGRPYQDPHMVLFTGAVRSACGTASSAVGPFYCPGDGKVYLDLSFFQEMAERLGAPGEFAQAYVIAHEIGHHVQNLLGSPRKSLECSNGVRHRAQRAFRTHGTAGRLFCRSLGIPCATAKSDRARRFRGRLCRGGGHRR